MRQTMPTKHIDDKTWRLVEKEMVKAVTNTQKPLKETEMLKILIQKGLEELTIDDIEEYLKEKGK